MPTMTLYGPEGTCTTNDTALRIALDVLRDNDRIVYAETRIGRRCSDMNVPCECLVCTHHRDGMLVVDFIDSDGAMNIFRVGGVGERYVGDTTGLPVRS